MVAIVKLLVMDVPLHGYGKIITIETWILKISLQYQVIIGNFPSCNCPNFINMSTTTLGRGGSGCHANRFTIYFAMCCIIIMNLIFASNKQP
jgi:hypothetical protein